MKITLNLLPEGQKKRLRDGKIFRKTILQEFFVLFLLLIVGAILFGINAILGVQLQSVEETQAFQQAQERYQELEEFENLFEQTNKRTTAVNNVQKHHLQWSHIFDIVSNALPEGIVVDRVVSEEGQMTVSGNAGTRDILLSFKEELSDVTYREQPCFANMEIPGDDIFAKENIDFVLTFDVQQTCARQQS